jgi:hypothetical protein
LNNFGYNYNVTLAHSSQVYITVVAINNAGLHSKAYSDGITKAHTLYTNKLYVGVLTSIKMMDLSPPPQVYQLIELIMY